jgi:hypothetical protein
MVPQSRHKARSPEPRPARAKRPRRGSAWRRYSTVPGAHSRICTCLRTSSQRRSPTGRCTGCCTLAGPRRLWRLPRSASGAGQAERAARHLLHGRDQAVPAPGGAPDDDARHRAGLGPTHRPAGRPRRTLGRGPASWRATLTSGTRRSALELAARIDHLRPPGSVGRRGTPALGAKMRPG